MNVYKPGRPLKFMPLVMPKDQELTSYRTDIPFYYSVNVYKAKLEPLYQAVIDNRLFVKSSLNTLSYLISGFGFWVCLHKSVIMGAFAVVQALVTSACKDIYFNRECGKRIM